MIPIIQSRQHQIGHDTQIRPGKREAVTPRQAQRVAADRAGVARPRDGRDAVDRLATRRRQTALQLPSIDLNGLAAARQSRRSEDHPPAGIWLTSALLDRAAARATSGHALCHASQTSSEVRYSSIKTFTLERGRPSL